MPRLLLGPSEVARKHAVGESLSLQHAVAAAREANLVDEAFAREAARAKSAVEQLALLEQVKVALDNGNVDPRLASADHEVRQQASFATTDEALRAQEFADYDQKHHPFSSKTGISPRHNARFATKPIRGPASRCERCAIARSAAGRSRTRLKRSPRTCRTLRRKFV